MSDPGRPSPARILAPLSLAVFLLAFFAIVLTSGSASGGGSAISGSPLQRTSTAAKKQPASYTVKVGDTLGSIAQTTGVPVQKLLDLNPNLDPQALVSGQKIQLHQ